MSGKKMSRFLIILVTLFCLYPNRPNCIFATPVTAAAHADQNVTYPPEIADQRHYLQSVVSELLTKVLIDPFKQIAKMTTLYLEIFSVASGTHILPIINTTSQMEDRQQQVIAIASTNLWLNLTMMESLNAIFLNASYAVTPILDNNTNTSTQALPRIIGEMFQKIETCVTKNNSLAPLYMEEKSKVEKLTLPVLASGTGNPDTTYQLYPRFRAFIVRRQILQHLTDGYNVNDTVKFQQHVLSQAVIQLANGVGAKRIQEIFDEAVQITMDKIDPAAKVEDPSGAIDRILFPVLEEKLTADFNDELTKVKQDLIKKYGM